jgi:tetratricopeptide (TPR) repeat protein
MTFTSFGNESAGRWFRVGLAVALLGATGISVSAQSQRKTPAKPPASAPSQDNDDPLAPLLQQATDAIDKMEFAAAVDPLQKYIAQRPDDPFAHFQLGFAFAGLKRPDDAKKEFVRAITLDPKMGAAHLNLGLVLMDSDPATAAEAFSHAGDLQPTESRPRFLAGYCFEQQGKLPEAIAQYRAALKLSPKDYETHFALGRVLSRSRDVPGSEAEFRAAVAIRGDSAEARLGLANTLLNERKQDEAHAALEEYLKLKPANHAALYDRALAYFELNQFDAALKELDLFDANNSATVDSLKMRADMYMQQQKWKEAGLTLVHANQIAPTDPEVAEWEGHVQVELHDYGSAIRILKQVLIQNPHSVEALGDISNAYFLNKNFAETLQTMDSLDKLEPPKPGAWFVRALCYDNLSRKAEAINAYQKFVDQDHGQHDTQDFQSTQRIIALKKELGKPEKK